MELTSFLHIAQILISATLIVVVLMQVKGTGFGAALGGADPELPHAPRHPTLAAPLDDPAGRRLRQLLPLERRRLLTPAAQAAARRAPATIEAVRVVFFGSPDYALPTLRLLIEAPAVDLAAVVTQPDRPRGRSGRGVPTPVARLAREAGVPVLTPERIRRDTTAQIAALEPDVGVLAASAHILPSHLIEAIPHGILNVHASLLPRHRGASPVAAAILAGDEESGASVMLIVRELDAGPCSAPPPRRSDRSTRRRR